MIYFRILIINKHPGFSNRLQWSVLVPLIGGRYHIIPQLAVQTTYIPLIYCLLGDYISPTTYQGNQKQLLISEVQLNRTDPPPNPPRTNSVRWSCPPRSRRRYEWPPVEVTTTECHFLGEGIFWDLGKDEYTSGRLTVRTWKWLFGRLFSFSIGCIVRFHVNLPGWKSFVIIGNRELRIAKNIYTKYECIYKNLGTCMYV